MRGYFKVIERRLPEVEKYKVISSATVDFGKVLVDYRREPYGRKAYMRREKGIQ
jgi:hypothetical protein